MKVKKNNIILIVALAILLALIAVILSYYPIKYFVAEQIQNSISGSMDFEEYFSDNQNKTDITKYYIDIELDMGEEEIKGKVVLEGKISSSNQIDLNFYDNLDISSLKLNGKKVEFEHEDNRLTVITNKNISQFTIEINYSGSPESAGLGSFNFEELNDDKYVYTLNEPIFASTWFPCNDLPDDKAFAEIRITNDSSAVSISNGILVGIENSGPKRTYHWKTVYPISTYLIAVYSGKYEKFGDEYISTSGDTLSLDYYVTKEKLAAAKIDFAFHSEVMKIFEELFGPYPFIKEKYAVLEFFWQHGAMENQTVTGMGSTFITGQNLYRDIYVHELAHHWWGNAVGPRTWKDIWLNEGFSTYSEALYWEKRSGKKSLISSMSAIKGKFRQSKLYDPGRFMFSRLVYDKGAWVLHMLRREIGDENFFSLMRNYFQVYKFKNASTSDLKKMAESISKKNLTTFFDQWVYSGKGILEVEYFSQSTLEENVYKTNLYIRQIQDEIDVYYFPLGVNVFDINGGKNEFKFDINCRDTNFVFLTKNRPSKIILDEESWLLAEITEVDSLF